MPAKSKKQQKRDKQAAQQKVENAAAAAEALVGLTTATEKANALKKLGGQFFVQGKYDEAVQRYTEALVFAETVDTKSAESVTHLLYSNRSACFTKLKKFTEAVADGEACIAAKPDFIKGYVRLGSAFQAMGEPMKGQKAYGRGMAVDPTNDVLADGIAECRKIIRRKLEKEDREKMTNKMKNTSLDDAKKPYVEARKQTDQEKCIGEYVIGIDLGTTFSCVSVWKDGKAVVLENADGKRTTPSWVAFTDEERLVGDQAKNQAAHNTTRTLFNIKRIIGRQFDECREDIKRMPFTVKKARRGGKPVIEVETDGKMQQFAPEQISAMVLERMKETAEAALGVPITKAVVTVPAYFNDSQRRLTKDAGTIAGLDILRIINEPTAAALAYGLDKSGEKKACNVLVFDLGGGTFDVSLLKIEEGVFKVLATAGDTHLGGEDFDSAVADWALLQLRARNNGDDPFEGDQKQLRKLRNACERAKRELSTTKSTSIEVFFKDEDIEIPLTRDKFNSLNEKVFQRCMNSVKRVLGDSKVSKEDVSDIVLVGGSTRVPRVREILQDYFNGKKLCHSVHPDEAVAYGAAVQGAILAGVRDPKTQALLLVDVTPLSLGVECQGKHFARVLMRNSSVPCKRSSEFTTVSDYQTSIDIRVFEGERTNCDGNHLLGEFTINDVERAKAGEAKVEVTFEVNTNGLLKVSARDKVTGSEAKVDIQHNRGRLNKDQIKQMCDDAAALRAADEAAVRLRAQKEGGAAMGGESEDDDW